MFKQLLVEEHVLCDPVFGVLSSYFLQTILLMLAVSLIFFCDLFNAVEPERTFLLSFYEAESLMPDLIINYEMR